MAFSASKQSNSPAPDPQSQLFFRRFQRQYAQEMQKLIKEHSLHPSSRTEAPSDLNLSALSAVQSHTPNGHRSKVRSALTPNSPHRKRGKSGANVYTQLINPYSRGRALPPKRKTVIDEIQSSPTVKGKESEKGIGAVAHIVSELKEMFAKAPKGVGNGQKESQESGVSHRGRREEIVQLPRLSISATPKRQAVDDTGTVQLLRRPRPTVRKVKDQVDLVGMQEYFTQFHIKSRNLLQRLEANVIGK